MPVADIIPIEARVAPENQLVTGRLFSFRLPLDGAYLMKACSKCKAEKPKTEFNNDRRSKTGLCSYCKPCVAEKNRAYKEANPEKCAANIRKWKKANAGKIAEASRVYYIANVDKISSRQRIYYESNHGKVAEYQRTYRETNPEKTAESKRAYREANPDKCAQATRVWSAANPDKVAEKYRRRRAVKSGADGSHTAEDVKAIFESQRGLCASCPEKLIKSDKNRYHVDHIQPLSKGGGNDKYNLQCLCPECNRRKSAKDPLDWARENGRLL